MDAARLDPHPFLSPAEVGALLRVDAETVVGWTRTGRLRCVYTSSGRRLYLKADLGVLGPELMNLDAAPSVAGATPAEGGAAPPTGQVAVSSQSRPDSSGDCAVDASVDASVVAEVVEAAVEADAELARKAVAVVEAAVLVAAEKVAAASARAHEARVFAASLAAETVAVAAAHAAEVERSRAAEAASRVQEAAQEAARLVLAATGSPEVVDADRRAAGRLAALVRAAAVASADEADAAATSRATTVDETAVQVALMARVVDQACEVEAQRVADELEVTTSAARVRLAAVTRGHVRSTASRAHRMGAAMMRSRPQPH